MRAAEGYVDAADPGQVFFHDVGEGWRRDAVSRMRPHQPAPFHQRLTAAAWQDHPSSYVICTRDQAIPAEEQRVLSARAQTVHRMATSHSPFLAQPAETAEVLRQALATTR